MRRYALIVISSGGEVMTFSSEVKGHSAEEILSEVKEAHGVDHEIVDIILMTSKNKIEFEQLDLSNLGQEEVADLDDDDDTDVEPEETDIDAAAFDNEDNDYEFDD